MDSIEQVLATHWDCLVVGTGIGGATLGHALAQGGKKVLFIEKGRASFQHQDTLRGAYPEMQLSPVAAPSTRHAALLARAGRFHDAIDDGGRSVVPLMGCGTGGSSALYGMAMERFLPIDFEPPQSGQGMDSVPRRRWPINYAELAPWYQSAERLYRVRGERDPLRPIDQGLPAAPALSAQNAELHQHFLQQGLHPYALPLACERVAHCTCCQGYLCDRDCKNDAGRMCLQPALQAHGAALLEQCEVVRLDADAHRVTGVVCTHQQQALTLRAHQVVLAAGALNTPALLLRSTSPSWPGGLANASGLVGRNLMRHFVDLYLVFTRTGGSHPLKEISISDFYQTQHGKLGTLQSFGQLPPAQMLTASLGQDLHDSAPWASPLFKLAQPLLPALLSLVLQRGMLLAAIMEDTPDADNRVLAGARPAISYRPRPDDLVRLQVFRQQVSRVLKPYRFLRLAQAENNAVLAHVCGTCRFGNNPADSVLDRNNRAHGVSNLFVVDAAFFPSSGGTNPGLTIAANALRVAHHMLHLPAETH